MSRITIAVLAASLSLALAACSPDEPSSPAAPQATTPAGAAPAEGTPPAPATATTNATPPAPGTQPAPHTLGLEGLDDLRIGEVVPAGGSWYERGAQEGTACRTVSSSQYPGVYAIVLDGKVQRISVGERSEVTLAEGVGTGDSEADVRKWFAGFREEPHKYESAPAKYLTAPNAASGDPALRIEIGKEGTVKFIHVGTMPALGYVEGCS